MPRANPNSLATKWVAQSDAMPDELIALEDAITAAKRAATSGSRIIQPYAGGCSMCGTARRS
jgi:hypothetical protein